MVNISIDKKNLSQLESILFDGKIVVIDNLDKLDIALDELSKCQCVGFDTETRPAFKKGVKHQVALIQISTENKCFLIRVSKIGLPHNLLKFFENDNVLKVGCSLNDDIRRLHEMVNFAPSKFLELQSLVKNYGIIDNGLSRIFAILFNHRISKGQQLTNWEIDVLTKAQQYYAATDAWACLKIYNYLITNSFKPEESKYVITTKTDCNEV